MHGNERTAGAARSGKLKPVRFFNLSEKDWKHPEKPVINPG